MRISHVSENAASTTVENVFTNAPQQITIDTATDKGLIIKAAASQSANLQEWQNSSGTPLLFVTSGGVLKTQESNTQIHDGVVETQYLSDPTWTSGPKLTIATTGWLLEGQLTTTTPIFGVKGIASQTGDLIQLKNSSGTVLASIGAGGLIRWNAAGNEQTGVGAAGGASAPPATPTKYLKIVDSAGTTLVVPAYAAA